MKRSHQLHRRTTFLFAAALCSSLLWLGCAEYDSRVGSDVVGADIEGTVRELFIPVERSATYELGDVFKSSTASLFIGEEDSLHSEIVLRYRNLSALGDTVLSVDSAWVMIFGIGVVEGPDDAMPADWSAEALRLDEFWDLVEANFETFQTIGLTPLDTVDLGTNWIAPEDTFQVDSFRVNLDEATILRWMSDDSLSNGILLRPLGEATFLKRFAPRTATDVTQIPVLRVRADFVNTDGDTLRDSLVTISPDFTSFYTNDLELPNDAGLVYLSQGFERHMLFEGDFSSLSASTASLNRVDLIVHFDRDWEHRIGVSSFLTWYDIVSDWDEQPDSVRYGIGSSLGYPIPSDKEVIRFNVTPPSRSWVAQPDSNRGVAVRPVTLGSAISRMAFYSEDAAIDSLRPYFHVIYTEYDLP